MQNKDNYDIRVLNLSLYSPVYAPYWADPLNLATTAAWQAGIVVVASAGNGGPNRINNRYYQTGGTSMSTAVVSGRVALMLSENPELTPDQVKHRLTGTARPQFSEYSGEAACSIWEQGAGRVWAPDAVFSDVEGEANQGMDIGADLAGEGYNSWAGGYSAWAGGYNSWAGSTGEPEWAAAFANLEDLPSDTSCAAINGWLTQD